MLAMNSENVVSVLFTYFQIFLLTQIENTTLLTFVFCCERGKNSNGNEEREMKHFGVGGEREREICSITKQR